jgi:hypothetical protein
MIGPFLRSLPRLLPRARKPAAGRRTTRLRLEALEDRLTPSWAGVAPAAVVPPPALGVGLNGRDAAAGAGAITANEVDWYRFTALGTGTYTFNIATPYSHMASVVGVFAASGDQLASNANGNRAVTSDKVTAALTAGQSYFLGVTNWSSTPGGGYYWSIVGPTLNNTLATAADLGTLSGPVTRSLQYLPARMSAWFRFRLSTPGDGASLASLTFNRTQGNLALRLTNAYGVTYRVGSATATGQQLSLSGLPAGKYYLQAYSPTATGNPNFSLTVVPLAPPPAGPPLASWIVQNLTDPRLQVLLQQDVADGSVSRTEMLGLFGAVSQDATLSAADFADLKTIVTDTSFLTMPDYVRDLAQKVVLGDPANADYQGQALGNLQAGSPATQLTELVDKWFLGLDHPLADPSSTYVPVAGTLFGSTISYTDIIQGEAGDCYFLAALGALARLDNGSGLRSMFIDNGDNTWTVRFYVNGAPDYVTVDRELPAAGGYLLYADLGADVTNPGNILWPALAEKAYAQENESGRLGRSGSANSYDSISGGDPSAATTLLTGRATGWSVLSSPSFAAIQSRFSAGDQVTFASDYPPADSNIVPGHAYTMIGYNAAAQTVTLYNPWGLAGGTYNGVQCDGVVTLTMTQLANDFLAWFYIA